MNSPAQLDRALLRLAAEFFMSATAELNRVYIKYDNYFSTIFGNPILEEGNRNRDVDVQFSRRASGRGKSFIKNKTQQNIFTSS